MSATTISIDVRGYSSTNNRIPYAKYFELCSYENWSLHNYVSLIIDNYENSDKRTAYSSFYTTLKNIINNLDMEREIRNVAQTLINRRKVSIINIINKIWWGFVARCFVPTAHVSVGIIQVLNGCVCSARTGKQSWNIFLVKICWLFNYVSFFTLSIDVFLHPPSNLIFCIIVFTGKYFSSGFTFYRLIQKK